MIKSLLTSINKIKLKIIFRINDLLFIDNLNLDYVSKLKNFGDMLSPIILKNISGKKINQIRSSYFNKTHYLGIGSILDRATDHSVVWGSGFISEKSTFISKPKKILAVRGKLTREILINNGVECPEVYGDPALLLPLYYNPKITKKYKLGIMPHYIDKSNSNLKKFRNDSDILIIDIQNPNPLYIIDLMLSCERIATSSLHGIILSDAYKIPNLWVSFSNKIIGGNFKYHDYFSSVNRPKISPIIFTDKLDKIEIIKKCDIHEITIDLDKLISSLLSDL
jgi:pyruvyltransferase